MAEKLHFHCTSPANIVRLMITILFEQTHTERDITVYHKRFDHESDDIFETFLNELYPDGAVIDETELNALTQHVSHFMRTDIKSKQLYADYDKTAYRSYVYFKPDMTVHNASCGTHIGIVQSLCLDYFKDFSYDEILKIDMYKFILDNFEIRSDYTSITRAADDYLYIQRSILAALR